MTTGQIPALEKVTDLTDNECSEETYERIDFLDE